MGVLSQLVRYKGTWQRDVVRWKRESATLPPRWRDSLRAIRSRLAEVTANRDSGARPANECDSARDHVETCGERSELRIRDRLIGNLQLDAILVNDGVHVRWSDA